MEYLLDTNVCVAMLRDQYGVRSRILAASIANCHVSEITIAELFYGAAKSGRKKHLEEVYNVMNMFGIVPIKEALEKYGHIKSDLEEAGTRIDDFDLLIGASALTHNMTIVTHNTKHFARIPNLTMEDWES